MWQYFFGMVYLTTKQHFIPIKLVLNIFPVFLEIFSLVVSC
jgi:hypothetical protein